jgi:hypothetical protein
VKSYFGNSNTTSIITNGRIAVTRTTVFIIQFIACFGTGRPSYTNGDGEQTNYYAKIILELSSVCSPSPFVYTSRIT